MSPEAFAEAMQERSERVKKVHIAHGLRLAREIRRLRRELVKLAEIRSKLRKTLDNC